MATLGARLAPRTAAASPRSPARARPQRAARAASRRALCAAKQALLSVSDKAGVAELAQVRAPQRSRAWPIDHRLHPMPSGGGTTLIAAAGAAVTSEQFAANLHHVRRPPRLWQRPARAPWFEIRAGARASRTFAQLAPHDGLGSLDQVPGSACGLEAVAGAPGRGFGAQPNPRETSRRRGPRALCAACSAPAPPAACEHQIDSTHWGGAGVAGWGGSQCARGGAGDHCQGRRTWDRGSATRGRVPLFGAWRRFLARIKSSG